MKKSRISYEQIMQDLKNKIYHPIYFLSGDEPYFMDKISDYILENVLTEEEKAFNQTILYGKETNAANIINTAKRFPMMANHQVVVVREAQEVKDFEKLIHYIQSPLESTILVLVYKYKKLDGRTSIAKHLKEPVRVFESKKIYEDKVPSWIADYLKKNSYSIDPKAAILLAEFLGNELQKVEKELEKLIITLPENMKTITADHIEKNIGISKDYNVFEFQKAFISKDVMKINRIINYFASNEKNNPLSLVISNLYFFFSKILLYTYLTDKSRQNVAAQLKINPYFVSDYEKAARIYPRDKLVRVISYLREYDMKSKGFGNISAGSGDILRELSFKIIH